MKVRNILASKTMELVTVHPEQSIKTAVKKLVEYNIGALPVLDSDGKLVGILSERDVIRWASETDDVLKLSVAEVMTRKVITGLVQDEVGSIANTMSEHNFRHMPILDGEDIVGILSIRDVMRVQQNMFRGELDTLETQVMADDE